MSGVERALQEGCTIHGFRSGGGLRVVRIEAFGNLLGYGEHPSVDLALVHANEDFLAGSRPYDEVYGKLYTHYLTGSHEVTSPLDGWLLQGHTFDAHKNEMGITVDLKGYSETRIPKHVIKQVNRNGRPVTWSNRGFTYETFSSTFPSGAPSLSTKVLSLPQGKSNSDPWIYKTLKTGMERRFSLALDLAFKAPEVELRR